MPTEIKQIESDFNFSNREDETLLGSFVFVKTKNGNIKFVYLHSPQSFSIKDQSCYALQISEFGIANKVLDIKSLSANYTCTISGASELTISVSPSASIGEVVQAMLQGTIDK